MKDESHGQLFIECCGHILMPLGKHPLDYKGIDNDNENDTNKLVDLWSQPIVDPKHCKCYIFLASLCRLACDDIECKTTRRYIIDNEV